jgi:hypothetical protein
MTPREKELMQGMSNCYRVCGANFEETVSMVGSARGLSSSQVKEMLAQIKEKHGRDKDFLELRKNLPSEFPI